MTNLGRSYTEANEALASVNLSVIRPQNIFATLIKSFSVAISRGAALELPCVDIPEMNRFMCFKSSSLRVLLITYKIIHETLFVKN